MIKKKLYAIFVMKLPLCSTLLAMGFHATAQGVTPEQIAKMKQVGSVAISDNGAYVAYVLVNPADPIKENLGSQAHLYVLNTATGETKPYHSSSTVGAIGFRPGKGTLTFLAKRPNDATNAIYEISLSGGEASKVYSYKTNILDFDWSNDGNKIVFSTSERGSTPKTTLTYKPQFFEEEFSDRKAYVVSVSSENATAQALNVPGAVYQMNWSPDNSKIAISVAPTSSVDHSYMRQGVKVVSAATRNVVATINNAGKLDQIEWSPDGRRLALKAGKDINDPTSGSILVVSADGGTPTLLDASFQGKYENISWQNPNDIYYMASVGAASSIGTISPDGRSKKILHHAEDKAIGAFAVSKNGTVAFSASTPSHPQELFTIGAKSKGVAQRRTFSNPWLNGLKLGKQEVVTYKARDGKYDIQGMLIYPLNYVAGTRYPLITVVHGGPESHYSNGWLTAYSMPGQMAAAEGYAVFYPNYRGSTGRGHDFGYTSQGDLSGKEFDDIVDGVDYLIGKGIADKDRIGVTGGSYGGYASAWMSTYYSDRFAAAVMFVGISNNLSKFGTSDIPEEMYLVHSRKQPWEEWENQLKISPIYYVDRSQTPILIMHGAEDPRVHPAQSMELYRHIKVRKPEVPVRLIYYPGEGHGNARSGSRYDYNLRMMQWFDTYLKTGNRKAALPSLDLPTTN